jgi:ATP-binding cassette subfamily F protein uup
VVTSTLAFEGDGRVQEFVGGYDDYLRQRGSGRAIDTSGGAKNLSGGAENLSGGATNLSGKNKKKRNFNEEREYQQIPDRIAALEDEQKTLQAKLADSTFYQQGGRTIQDAVDRLEQVEHELLSAIERWDVLDSVGK